MVLRANLFLLWSLSAAFFLLFPTELQKGGRCEQQNGTGGGSYGGGALETAGFVFRGAVNGGGAVFALPEPDKARLLTGEVFRFPADVELSAKKFGEYKAEEASGSCTGPGFFEGFFHLLHIRVTPFGKMGSGCFQCSICRRLCQREAGFFLAFW